MERGQIENAHALLLSAVGAFARQRWIEASGKTRTDITCPERLITKLRSSSSIDRWTGAILLAAVKRPPRVARRHVEVLLTIVEAIVLDAPAGRVCESRPIRLASSKSDTDLAPSRHATSTST
ncbi:MAG: hypothetical protein CMJ58_16900 [Planctomycetaceae bacterium]|nr:hypothetical protein [Planctomycetaceae bacterium]